MKWFVLVAVAAVLSGCGGAPVASSPEPVASAPVAPSSAPVGVDCLDASKMGAAVMAGARDGFELEPVRAAAVRSPDFSEVYFVAVEFKGYPGESRGVWASNSLKPGGGLLMSVDGPAVEVTDWPAAIDAAARISSTDPSVDAALSCL